jgi:hypothetical protein
MTDLDDMESRLREFRPRRPAAIPHERLQWLRRPMWMALAAGIAATIFVATRLQAPASPPQRLTTVTLGPLTAIAIQHPNELDDMLTELSRTSLPDVTRQGGVLEHLSKL